MDIFVDIILVVLIFAVLALLFLLANSLKTKEEREYEKKLKESLADEFIIDPETGTKLTLEQAESGHWIAHDNEFATTPEHEIQKSFTEEDKLALRAINYLKGSREYLKHTFTDEDINILNNTKILSKYDDWEYSNLFRLTYCEGYVFLPAVKWIDKQPGYFENTYQESQIMFWITLGTDCGHYYLREKTVTEKFFDHFKSDDDLKLDAYECFTYRKAENIFAVLNYLKAFEHVKGLEIEFMGFHLFFKTRKLVNNEDLYDLEKIARKF